MKTPLKVEIPDTEHWKAQIKCQYACPVHTDARGYVRAVAEGDFEKAYLIARAPNPLASMCGRVCGAPCEVACRRGDIDQSIFIRGLKRTAEENAVSADLKALELVKKITETINDRSCVSADDAGLLVEYMDHERCAKTQGKSIGIIGSGPAGLAAGHDLALMGFSPVIYEMESKAAGLLYYGVPAYRLPRELLEAEVKMIESLGVEIHTDCTVGKDVTIAELRERHDAVIISVGLKKSRSVPLPGDDAEGVLGGIEFLRDVAFDLPRHIGNKVVVIGGGNVAYDVARSALRQQQVDIAGTALRERSGVTVSLVCLEPETEMLADELEILEGGEEGVVQYNAYGPQEILTENGKATGVLFHRVTSILDKNNRFNPQYDPADTLTVEADTVLFAVGQRADISFIDPEQEGIQLSERGLIVCDQNTYETTADHVYVAGDMALGPGLMIDAIANGKEVARAIYHKLTGEKIDTETLTSHGPIEAYSRESGYESIARQIMDEAPTQERIISLDEIIELGYPSRDKAMVEGSRCLDCGVNPIFDGNLCILCGGCADVCPELCLKLVPVSELEGGKSFDDLVNLVKEEKEVDILSAIVMDDKKCIRCGLCAVRCPTDAITMERFSFKECLK